LDTDNRQRGVGANPHVDAATPILDTNLYGGNGNGDGDGANTGWTELRRRCHR
jgi:hypothetical protein